MLLMVFFLKWEFFHHKIRQKPVGACVKHPVLFVVTDSGWEAVQGELLTF